MRASWLVFSCAPAYLSPVRARPNPLVGVANRFLSAWRKRPQKSAGSCADNDGVNWPMPAGRPVQGGGRSIQELVNMSALLAVFMATMTAIIGITGGLFQQALAF